MLRGVTLTEEEVKRRGGKSGTSAVYHGLILHEAQLRQRALRLYGHLLAAVYVNAYIAAYRSKPQTEEQRAMRAGARNGRAACYRRQGKAIDDIKLRAKASTYHPNQALYIEAYVKAYTATIAKIKVGQLGEQHGAKSALDLPSIDEKILQKEAARLVHPKIFCKKFRGMFSVVKKEEDQIVQHLPLPAGRLSLQWLAANAVNKHKVPFTTVAQVFVETANELPMISDAAFETVATNKAFRSRK